MEAALASQSLDPIGASPTLSPLALSEEQVMVRDMVRRLLRESQDEAALGCGPMPAALWQKMASLGVGMALLPERAGGLGGSPRDVALVAEEFGRALTVAPLAEGLVAATGLVARCGENAAVERWVNPVVAGGTPLAWAGGVADIAADGSLSGQLRFVRWAQDAPALVVPAEGTAYIIPTDAEGVVIDGDFLLDGTPTGNITLHHAQGERLPLPQGAVAEAAALAQLAYVAEMVGAMALLHWQTADYVQQRRQFGAAIFSFQAVQHKLARMFVLLEQSRSLLLKAASHQSTAPGFGAAVTSAKAYVADAAQHLAEEAVQLHGGIGITDELIVGRGLRRIAVLARLFGSAEEARVQLMR